MRTQRQFVNRTADTLTINRSYKNFAGLESIIQRVRLWTSIARTRPLLRIPELHATPSGNLQLVFPPVPEGFVRAVNFNPASLPFRCKLGMVCGWLETLQGLHESGFYMGFLTPEHIIVSAEGGLMCDVQPFPSIMPFLTAATGDYPTGMFPHSARGFRFPRRADYSATAGLIQWLFTGIWSLDIEDGDGVGTGHQMPEGIQELCRLLREQAELFLTACEIAEKLKSLYPEETSAFTVGSPETWERVRPEELLHSPSLPLFPDELAALDAFVNSRKPMSLAVTGEDRTERFHTVRILVNRSVENNMYLTVQCSSLPFSTIRTIIDRLVAVAMEHRPQIADALIQHRRSLEQAFSKHFQGADIHSAIIHWLSELFGLVHPLLDTHRLVIVFEHCEQLDAASIPILYAVWNRIKSDGLPVRFLFSGDFLPVGSPVPCRSVDLNLRQTERACIFISSQLGRADPAVISHIARFFADQRIPYSSRSSWLELFVSKGCLRLENGSWTGRCPEPDEPLRSEALSNSSTKNLPDDVSAFLHILTCLPSPVRVSNIYGSALDMNTLERYLLMLQDRKLIQAYHTNSVYVPDEVAAAVQSGWSGEERRTYNKQAFDLLRKYGNGNFGPLILLAERAEDIRSLYFMNILYYRMNRTIMKIQHKQEILERLSELHMRLCRPYLPCWDRLLYGIYLHNLNEFQKAYLKAESLARATGSHQDTVLKHRALLMQGISKQTGQLLELLEIPDVSLKAKVYAAETLIMHDYRSEPIGLEAAQKIRSFYHNELYPSRGSISTLLFAQISIVYMLMVSKYLPEREAWGLHFRQKLEMILEDSSYQNQYLRLLNSYLFQKNIRLASRYNRMYVEAGIRLGSLNTVQTGCVNGIELSVQLGDLSEYRRYIKQTLASGPIGRKDLQGELVLHQLQYAVEWGDDETWHKAERQTEPLELSQPQKDRLALYRLYHCFRKGLGLEELHELPWNGSVNRFAQALYEINRGQLTEACTYLEECINRQGFMFDGYGVVWGWAYRELISILLTEDPSKADQWLRRFETFLNETSLQLFAPDYDLYNGIRELGKRNMDHSFVYLKRAMNGFLAMEKHSEHQRASDLLEQGIRPEYLDEMCATAEATPLEDSVRLLAAERREYVLDALELRQCILLAERLADPEDLNRTLEALQQALFHHYPLASIHLEIRLPFRHDKKTFTAHGSEPSAQQAVLAAGEQGVRTFRLYESQGHHITLTACSLPGYLGQDSMDVLLGLMKPYFHCAVMHEDTKMDTLTRFYVRRHFLQMLDEEFKAETEYGLGLSVIMLDIDNFRKVNEFGHHEGDRVLSELSDLLRSVLRKHDIPGRYGGEEFIIILPKTDGAIALRLAEEIRRQVEHRFRFGRPCQVTVSVGVACRELCGAESSSELVRLADEAEIRAKQQGKNRVIAAW